MCILITNCKRRTHSGKMVLELPHITTSDRTLGWKCVGHVTVKWLPGLLTLTISKSDKGLELCAVRTGYILSVQHKLTIHSVYQQSIKTDDSFPLIHKNIISGEQKDRKTATIFLLLRLMCVSAYVQDNIKCTGE